LLVFEAIANETIRSATKIHLLHHVIGVYVMIKLAILCAQVYGPVKDKNPHYLVNIV